MNGSLELQGIFSFALHHNSLPKVLILSTRGRYWGSEWLSPKSYHWEVESQSSSAAFPSPNPMPSPLCHVVCVLPRVHTTLRYYGWENKDKRIQQKWTGDSTSKQPRIMCTKQGTIIFYCWRFLLSLFLGFKIPELESPGTQSYSASHFPSESRYQFPLW